MRTPQASIKIMALFQKAVKTGDTNEIEKIPLKDVKMAKAHLVYDKNQPFYIFMQDYIDEREKMEKAEFKKNNSIFISHINEEAPIALYLQALLLSIFKGVSVFVSSDYESIRSGKEWYDAVVENARLSKIVLVLLSKQAIHRPWINFEAGVGAGTLGDVIPIVGRNLKKQEIPPPLQFRHARDLRDPKDVEALLRDISQSLQQPVPTGDWANFSREICDIMNKLPYQGLFIDPYCSSGDAHSHIIQFRLVNNGTIDMDLIAVEGSIPENLLLSNWGRSINIPNLSVVKTEKVDGVMRFCHRCYSYPGPIPPGLGHPPRLPECLTPSMSPHDFPTLRFVLRTDLSEEDLNQVIEYKVLAKDFITENHTLTIREILKKT